MSRPTGPPVSNLTEDVHVWPDFHGNRSPLADPNVKSIICGMTLDASEKNLALHYLATIQALCYGTRHIIESMRDRDVEIGCLLLCGGLTKIDLFAVTMANAVGLPVVLPNKKESVLLGSAMLGACASTHFSSLNDQNGWSWKNNSTEPTRQKVRLKYRMTVRALGKSLV